MEERSRHSGPPEPNPYPPGMEQRITAAAAQCMIRLIGGSMRLRIIGEEHLDSARESTPGGRVAFAFWHGHQFPLVYVWRKKGVAILTSMSRDGTLQSLIMGGLGYHIVRGSTSRGAIRGMVGIIRSVKEGHDSAFAVDGPRGPYHEVTPGVLYTALKTGTTIVPITCAVEKARIFDRAWDCYIFPWPFTRVVVAYGEGMKVSPETGPDEFDRLSLELSERLDALTARAEQTLSEG